MAIISKKLYCDSLLRCQCRYNLKRVLEHDWSTLCHYSAFMLSAIWGQVNGTYIQKYYHQYMSVYNQPQFKIKQSFFKFSRWNTPKMKPTHSIFSAVFHTKFDHNHSGCLETVTYRQKDNVSNQHTYFAISWLIWLLHIWLAQGTGKASMCLQWHIPTGIIMATFCCKNPLTI